MPLLEYTGNAVLTTLTEALTPTTLVMKLGNASGWPTGVSANWVATIDRFGPNEEKVLCGTRTGNDVTILQRGYDGTTPKAHGLESVTHTISAVAMNEASRHVNDTGRDDHTQYLTVPRHDDPARHGTSVLQDLSVTTAKLANLAVATGKLQDLAVTTAKVADDAVTLAKLGNDIYGSPVPVGATNADGVAVTVARSDHQHADLAITTKDDWVPTLTASTVNPTLGDAGSVLGWYQITDEVIEAYFAIIVGTSGSAAGTGTYQIDLPPELTIHADESIGFTIGSCEINDSGTGRAAVLRTSSPTRLVARITDSQNLWATTNVPMGLNDFVKGSFRARRA